MDMLGDAEAVEAEDGVYDEYDAGGEGATRLAWLTPETRAVTAISLVFFSFFASTPFQFLSFVVVDRNDGTFDAAKQYAVYAGPAGLVAALGALMGWRVAREVALDGRMRALAGAAVLVGLFVAAVTVVGIIVGFSVDNPNL